LKHLIYNNNRKIKTNNGNKQIVLKFFDSNLPKYAYLLIYLGKKSLKKNKKRYFVGYYCFKNKCLLDL